jgi:hypothetical protein
MEQTSITVILEAIQKIRLRKKSMLPKQQSLEK